MLLNLSFHVDDEWRDVPAETMRDEFIDGLLAVPGVKSGRRFVLKLPAQPLGGPANSGPRMVLSGLAGAWP